MELHGNPELIRPSVFSCGKAEQLVYNEAVDDLSLDSGRRSPNVHDGQLRAVTLSFNGVLLNAVLREDNFESFRS